MIIRLLTNNLTNDIIGSYADQAYNRAFSTNATPAFKVERNLFCYCKITSIISRPSVYIQVLGLASPRIAIVSLYTPVRRRVGQLR